jgi:hypothetical protein
LVSRTSDEQFAETPPVETTKNSAPASAVAAETSETAAPSAGPMGGAALGSSDQYRVDLADSEQKQLEEERAGVDKVEKPDLAKSEALKARAQQALPETDPNQAFYDSNGVLSDRKTAGKGDAVATKPAVKSPDTGLELRRREPTPKDFDEAKPAENKVAKKPAPRVEGQYGSVAPADDALGGEAGYANDGRAANRGGAGGTATAPGAAAPTTPAPPPPPPPKTAPRQEIATDSTTAGASARDAQKSKEKVANDPNLAWAKDQHAALVTAVRANNCGRAANIALSIENRTPAYYAQNVETDRSVKQCIAYINNEREKDAEVRASRAKKSQLKNAEPSAPKRAADQPSKATTTDSSK